MTHLIASTSGRRNNCTDSRPDRRAGDCKCGNVPFPSWSTFASVRARGEGPHAPCRGADHGAHGDWMPADPASSRPRLRLDDRGGSVVFRPPGRFSLNRLAQRGGFRAQSETLGNCRLAGTDRGTLGQHTRRRRQCRHENDCDGLHHLNASRVSESTTFERMPVLYHKPTSRSRYPST